MRPTRRVALGCVTIAVLAFAAPPAEAQTIFRGAGYKLTVGTNGVTQAATTFRVPTVTCTGIADETDVSFGLYSRGIRWGAGLDALCRGNTALYSLFATTTRSGTGTGFDVSPGDLVQVSLQTSGSGSAAATRFTVHDATNGDSAPPLTGTGSLDVVSVGAFAGTQVPAFPTVTMSATVNDSVPFTRTDYVRHTEYRGDTKVIGSGFPWNDGLHFNIYFKHR